MALIHQNLYNKDNLKGIPVKAYVEMLAKDLFQTYRIDEERVELSMDIQEINIDIDFLVPLGLIINELITNSLKYAFPGEKEGSIGVYLREEGTTLNLSVVDNGVGYDLASRPQKTFGRTLVKTLTEQLEGVIKESTEGGSSTEIVFSKYS